MPSVIRVAIPANKSDAALKDYFRELVEDSHLGDFIEDIILSGAPGCFLFHRPRIS